MPAGDNDNLILAAAAAIKGRTGGRTGKSTGFAASSSGKRSNIGTRTPEGFFKQANGRVLCYFHAKWGTAATRCTPPCADAGAVAICTSANAYPLGNAGGSF